MSLYTELQMLLAKYEAENTDEAEPPKTLDELRATMPSIKDEFAQVLQDAATQKHGEQ